MSDLIWGIIVLALGGGILFMALNFARRLRNLTAREASEDENSLRLMREWMGDTRRELQETRREMQQSLSQNRESVQGTLDKTNREINSRLDNAAKVIGGVQHEVGQMKELGRQMRDLQDFLQSPKLRGNLGEQILNDLLAQVLPRSSFNTQYKFKDGQTVDAVIKTDRGMICIDSKFPLESWQRMVKSELESEKVALQGEFRRAVKKHIDDIAKKYILPSEGTFDFAIMYLPSEAVYYELMTNHEEVNAYAQQKRVFPMSPNTFYYILRVILLGFEGQKIEEQAQKVLQMLGTLRQDSEKLGKDISVLDRHLTNAQGSMGEVNKHFGKLSNRIEETKLLE